MNRVAQISSPILADLLRISRKTMDSWIQKRLFPYYRDSSGVVYFQLKDLVAFEPIRAILASEWEQEHDTIPRRRYTSIELFAGAGGLALGLEQAGFHHLMVNELDRNACQTLQLNRPEWQVVAEDIRAVSFKEFRGKVDLLSGGFPCQAFSYAGTKGGFKDTRGTLFFEMARAADELRPKLWLGENVRGLLNHDSGKTLATITGTIKELGYELIDPKVLQAISYKVPQKRERLFLIAIRKDLYQKNLFRWPSPYYRVMCLRDALCQGELYATDVPPSEGMLYSEKKKQVMELVPEGGDWRDLPEDVQRAYMGASYFLGGGKTGMARRLSLDEPSLTLTCSPSQKQTERCHPLETRPLSVREYARIQTFPDTWKFVGSMHAAYKQIGNAVPVNLAQAVGLSLVRYLNDIEK